MADYDDAGYYELQLNNKQLVFFFMAAVAIAVVVFLCGVMVGRGVRDATIAAAGTSIATTPETPPASGMTPADVRKELDYQQRLESPKVEERLEGTSSSPEKLVQSATKNQTAAKAQPTTAKSAPPPSRPAPKKAPPKAGGGSAQTSTLRGSEAGTYTIQVVALKTRDAADNLVSRLRTKRYRAYVETGGSTGLFRVRVGRFQSRTEADRVAQMLRDTERFKPFVTQ
jgi:cell division septation protein DedD